MQTNAQKKGGSQSHFPVSFFWEFHNYSIQLVLNSTDSIDGKILVEVRTVRTTLTVLICFDHVAGNSNEWRMSNHPRRPTNMILLYIYK